MIFYRTINGKKVQFETNSQGDIISRDGKPIETKHKSIDELQSHHKEKMYGFMQRGSNKRSY